MIKVKLGILICLMAISGQNIAVAGDNSVSVENLEQKMNATKSKMDSMDKIAAKVQGGLDSMDIKLKEAGARIKEMEAAKNRKPNYWMPILGGALLGIGLAVWLKKRK